LGIATTWRLGVRISGAAAGTSGKVTLLLCCAKRSEAVNCHSCRPRHHGASDQDDKRPDGRFCHCHPPRNRHKRAAYCRQMCSRRVRRNSFRIRASTGVAPKISGRRRAQYFKAPQEKTHLSSDHFQLNNVSRRPHSKRTRVSTSTLRWITRQRFPMRVCRLAFPAKRLTNRANRKWKGPRCSKIDSSWRLLRLLGIIALRRSN